MWMFHFVLLQDKLVFKELVSSVVENTLSKWDKMKKDYLKYFFK